MRRIADLHPGNTKTDAKDAFVIADAARTLPGSLRQMSAEPDLPVAGLDGPDRELRLLVDHREDLVNERTRIPSRLRWHLHELDPGWVPPAKIDRTSAFGKITAPVDSLGEAGLVARLARKLLEHLRALSRDIDEKTAEITTRITV